MFSQQLQILFFELIRHFEVGMIFYLLIREKFDWVTGIEQMFVSLGFQLFLNFVTTSGFRGRGLSTLFHWSRPPMNSWRPMVTEYGAAAPVSYSMGIFCPSIRIMTSFRSSCPHRVKEVQSFEKVFIDAIENVQTDITKLQILLGA